MKRRVTTAEKKHHKTHNNIVIVNQPIFSISSALQQRSIEAYTCTDGSNLMIQSNHTFKFE